MNVCLNLFPFPILIRILRLNIAIYLEQIPPHDPVTSLPDLTITDEEHNYLKMKYPLDAK